ncbi:terminase small subunit [Clostridium sp.]|uniref:terminase small subunit n=1 Tax=Clostridium sp. TaxID=1506 RepID=UPI00262907BE|nr:terminase small subunit [Clostridium sp.]
MAKLTDKQMIFANEYLVDLNATRAYKKAYPNVKKDSVAAVNGNRLLRNAKVKNYIDEQLNKIQDESIAKVEEVLKYLTKGMRMELEEEVVVTENIGDYMSEAKIVKKQISIKDANKCAELLGKRYRLFVDKVEQTVDATVNSTKKLDSILGQLTGEED